MSRMAFEALPVPARWTSRLAFFSVGVLLSAVFLHRVFSMPTPTAMNLAVTGYVIALLAVVLGALGAIRIWSDGSPGTARVVVGLIIGVTVLAAPVVVWLSFERLPPISDLTTDPVSPPPFVRLAELRDPAANPADYPGAVFAKAQVAAYPDLKPMTIERSSEETFEVVAEALRRLKMNIVLEEPPEEGRSGMIEAVDRTLVLGFYDDVSVRVSGDAQKARVDLRSASRYGSHDFGRNAERLRRIMREIVARLEATVPTASGERLVRRGRGERLPRRGKAVDPKTRLLKRGQRAPQRVLSPSSAQRGPEQKGLPPSPGERRAPGKRSAQ